MCSVAAMPAELLVGHSRGHHFLYSNPLLAAAAAVSSSAPIVGSSITTTTTTTVPISTPAIVKKTLRPCLSSSELSTLPSSEESSFRKNHSSHAIINLKTTIKNPPTSTTGFNKIGHKTKKKVVFADDHGRPLTQIRVMSESKDRLYPLPRWMQTSSYLESLARVSQSLSSWTLCFQLPASDYLTFRRKLEENAVSLENVTIKQTDDHCLTGTVKVRNLAYDKQVIIRSSCDNWTSYEDNYCTYVEVQSQPQVKNGVIKQQSQPIINHLYDTFRFQVVLPITSNNIEFCVCYRVNGMEYWDNNDGNNYIVRKQQEKEPFLYSSSELIIRMQQAAVADILLPLSEIGAIADNESVNYKYDGDVECKTAGIMKYNNSRSWSSKYADWQRINHDIVPYW